MNRQANYRDGYLAARKLAVNAFPHRCRMPNVPGKDGFLCACADIGLPYVLTG
ncbi:MAG: hypothetical protein K2O18_08125 [Oscillospiraceae bacterium]|nr:hypothetical protein [Oscillospiraceae bacterium]